MTRKWISVRGGLIALVIIVSILLVLAGMILFQSSAYGGAADPQLGDVNADGNIDAEDAAWILRHAVGLVDLSDDLAFPDARIRADANRDGRITLRDAWLVFLKSRNR